MLTKKITCVDCGKIFECSIEDANNDDYLCIKMKSPKCRCLFCYAKYVYNNGLNVKTLMYLKDLPCFRYEHGNFNSDNFIPYIVSYNL